MSQAPGFSYGVAIGAYLVRELFREFLVVVC